MTIPDDATTERDEEIDKQIKSMAKYFGWEIKSEQSHEIRGVALRFYDMGIERGKREVAKRVRDVLGEEKMLPIEYWMGDTPFENIGPLTYNKVRKEVLNAAKGA